MTIEVTKFAQRHWKKESSGTKLLDWPIEDFTKYVNHIAEWDKDLESDLLRKSRQCPWIEKHAEWQFCKYLILPLQYHNINIQNIYTGQVRNSLEIQPFIRTGYVSRNESELEYLSRWVELPYGFKSELAKYLIVILYSKEQLDLEAKKTGDESITAEWGVVGLIGSIDGKIPPPPPSTILRNSMDPKYGGNGTPFNPTEYAESCKYWQEWILCK